MTWLWGNDVGTLFASIEVPRDVEPPFAYRTVLRDFADYRLGWRLSETFAHDFEVALREMRELGVKGTRFMKVPTGEWLCTNAIGEPPDDRRQALYKALGRQE